LSGHLILITPRAKTVQIILKKTNNKNTLNIERTIVSHFGAALYNPGGLFGFPKYHFNSEAKLEDEEDCQMVLPARRVYAQFIKQ
jgi:hypothetical protein